MIKMEKIDDFLDGLSLDEVKYLSKKLMEKEDPSTIRLYDPICIKESMNFASWYTKDIFQVIGIDNPKGGNYPLDGNSRVLTINKDIMGNNRILESYVELTKELKRDRKINYLNKTKKENEKTI